MLHKSLERICCMNSFTLCLFTSSTQLKSSTSWNNRKMKTITFGYQHECKTSWPPVLSMLATEISISDHCTYRTNKDISTFFTFLFSFSQWAKTDSSHQKRLRTESRPRVSWSSNSTVKYAKNNAVTRTASNATLCPNRTNDKCCWWQRTQEDICIASPISSKTISSVYSPVDMAQSEYSPTLYTKSTFLIDTTCTWTQPDGTLWVNS